MKAIERLPRTSIDTVAASIKAMTPLMTSGGALLAGALCARLPDDPELVEIASHGLASFPAIHLLAAVHYLLLRDPRDPLARYYATLTANPAPVQDAFADFARYCKTHREEILQILATRTIQATVPERCPTILGPLSLIADRTGEPLDLIEIGCSAGILLTFDRYAYELKGRGVLGDKDAPLTFSVDMHGGPELHIPRIGERIGLDLRPVDVRSEDEQRWLLAQLQPEWLDRRAQLTTALDVVASTNISFFEGDALDVLPELIAKSPGPLCVYHSACVVYWSPEAKARLNAQLLEASRGRGLYRVGIEPDLERSARSAEIIVTHYRDGAADAKVIAETSLDSATITWRD